MSFCYYKIDNITKNGNELYYKKPIILDMHKATIFNDKYIYYYKYPISLEINTLGTFKRISKCNSGCRYNDYDYDIYEFSDAYISCDDKINIYCSGKSDSDENMVRIEDMFYEEYPIYLYNKNLITPII
jgi:hypothetical protein